jgi:hypothetical protein
MNLWDSSEHRARRDDLIDKLLRWQVTGTLRSRIRSVLRRSSR